MAYYRADKSILLGRLKDEPRRFIQVLYGPRQIGKTTLVRQVMAELDYPSQLVAADAVPAGDQAWIAQQWEAARIRQSQDSDKPYLLVIDEVQKIDNWSEQVKAQWDKDTADGRDIRLVLLGSSRLMLQQGLTESLAGRFEATYLGHWSLREMREAFGLSPEEFVWFGGYPGAITLKSDEERWKSYIRDSLLETSISKDILMLTRVDKPAMMKRLFELGASYSGQILSFTKIMGQLSDAGNTTTLANYLSLLNDAGLLGGLEKYSPNMVRKRSSSPKFQVHNTAIMSGVSGESLETLLQQPSVWGRWVESAVGAHLLNQTFRDKRLSLSYWKEVNDEVDFVLEYKGKAIGIEVKSGHGGNTSGLSVFKEKFQPHKVLLVGANGIPWQEFLEIDAIDLF